MTTPTANKPRQTLDQRRALHAWDCIQSMSGRKNGTVEPSAEAKEYGREAKKLPTRILAAGLGQALAFLDAKKTKKPGLQKLQEHLTDWVVRNRSLGGLRAESLLHNVIKGDSTFLRRATDEALAYLQWLVRFADAEGLTEGEENADHE
jgi:CRISPR-associated protein Cmr5